MDRLTLVLRDPKELKAYENNARIHDEKQIRQIEESIRKFGFTTPVEITDNDVILSGHARVLAAINMELKTVPTIVLSKLNGAERKAYSIAANKIAMNAGWDFELLQTEFKDLMLQDFDVSLTGFSEDDVFDLLKGQDDTEEDGKDTDEAQDNECPMCGRKG